MTYKVLKDLIEAKAKLEAVKRNVPFIKLQDTLIFEFITQAEDEIQRRMGVIKKTLDVTLTTLPYTLPSDFGKVITITDDNYNSLTYKDPQGFQEAEEGSEPIFTIIWANNKTLHMKPEPTSTSYSILYLVSIIPFSDSSLTSASTIQLSKEFYKLIEYHVLSNLFVGFENLIEEEYRRLKGWVETSPDSQLMGGIGV